MNTSDSISDDKADLKNFKDSEFILSGDALPGFPAPR
jgi:hypothetical protein